MLHLLPSYKRYRITYASGIFCVQGEYYSPRPLSFDSTLGYGSFPGGYPPALPPFPLYYPPPYGYPPLIPPYGFGPPPVDYRARSDSYGARMSPHGLAGAFSLLFLNIFNTVI